MRNLIVARFNEPLDWLDQLKNCNIYVYNKGDRLDCSYTQIQLENVGREAHTYLYHILNNEPADYNIFIQANPFDHCLNAIYEIDNLESDFTHLKSIRGKLYCDNEGLPHHKLPLKPYFEKVLGYCPKIIEFIPSACFIVSKQRLLSISKKDYEKLYNISLEPLGAWILERLWGYIWN